MGGEGFDFKTRKVKFFPEPVPVLNVTIVYYQQSRAEWIEALHFNQLSMTYWDI